MGQRKVSLGYLHTWKSSTIVPIPNSSALETTYLAITTSCAPTPTDLNTDTSPSFVSASHFFIVISLSSANLPTSIMSSAPRPAAMISLTSIAHELIESTTIVPTRLMRSESTSTMLRSKRTLLLCKLRSHGLRRFGRWSYRLTQVLQRRQTARLTQHGKQVFQTRILCTIDDRTSLNGRKCTDMKIHLGLNLFPSAKGNQRGRRFREE